jgi:hypothetical protein
MNDESQMPLYVEDIAFNVECERWSGIENTPTEDKSSEKQDKKKANEKKKHRQTIALATSNALADSIGRCDVSNRALQDAHARKEVVGVVTDMAGTGVRGWTKRTVQRAR